jgi:hypothetical protein
VRDAVLRAIFGFIALSPALLVAVLAYPRLSDGVAQSKAAPVPSAMIAGVQLDPERYRYAAGQLEKTTPANGEGGMEAAEAARYAGAGTKDVAGRLRTALTADPASARGWMLLAEATVATDPVMASSALAQSFLLAPNDYYLAYRRANDAAQNWDRLGSDAQRMAIRQVHTLWDQEGAHPLIRPLLLTSAGVALVNRTFADDKDDLRALNRWLATDRLRRPTVVHPWP